MMMDLVIAETTPPLRSERDSCLDPTPFARIAPSAPMAKGPLPSRRPPMRELHQTVERIYQEGPRSSELAGLVRAIRGPLALRLVMTAAEYVLRLWEGEEATATAPRSPHSKGMMVQVMSATLLRVNPSVITLFAALYYIGRLRKMFPHAKGELGCGVRLFTVALLIAYRYHEGAVADAAFYRAWSAHSHGLFSARDLLRMEVEMVAFLGYALHIPFEDFEYFVDRVFNADLGQVVPRCLDMHELARPAGGAGAPLAEGGDATVPTGLSNVPPGIPPYP